MKLRNYLFLALLGLAGAVLVAGFQHNPGYMDAEYYYAGGLRLAGGHGFSEPFLWNYLDDPAGLPHPSHAYWMPLASLLAAAGMRLGGGLGFEGAQIGFVLVAALLPPLTAALGLPLTGRPRSAILGGLLAAFPGFYAPFLTTTDTFGLYMLLGGLFLLLAGGRGAWGAGAEGAAGGRGRAAARLLGLGVLAGLMHLARADGLLWLGLALGLVFMEAWTSPSTPAGRGPWIGRALLAALLVCAGYLAVMGPWMARNLNAFGTPLAPGGAQALWMTDYNELFIYPAGQLTPERWWATGLGAILHVRSAALSANLQTALAVQGAIFLAPLVLLGGWRLRIDSRVRLGAAAWLLTLTAMNLVFPLAGGRGGFFHSGAALQPLFWALAPVGLDTFIAWGERRRGWRGGQARAVFSAGLVGLALLLTVLLVSGRVQGGQWGEPQGGYVRLEGVLQAQGARPEDVVMVNNAPGYFIASSRPAISIPYADLDGVLAAAQRYGARYLILEIDQILGARDLYTHPSDRPGLRYLTTAYGAHLYEIQAP